MARRGPRRGRLMLPVMVMAGAAASAAGAQEADEELIEEGRRLFFEETFDGNGRTCGTCHPATNNFTVDPEFIATLPGDDPLFVAKGKLNPLEENRLIRRFGLFVENLDGFDNPGVLRGAPHTLALPTSIRPPEGFPLTHATGWSGDGAPGDGSIRDFATGAVIQHFPKSIRRRPGVDFRLPTERELVALEAFQLSLGRQEEVNITPGTEGVLRFADRLVERGKELFNRAPARDGGTRACAGCHNNAGANRQDNGLNGNFDTGTAQLANAPACLPSSKAPGDGGLGPTPEDFVDRRDLCGKGRPGQVPFRGDGTFNTPPLVEAADTAPFFHNNTAATVEEAVRFYTSDTFDASPAGSFGGAFVLGNDGVQAIGALLRALNALENIRIAGERLDTAVEHQSSLDGRDREEAEIALAELTDAIEVLTEGPAKLFPRTDAVELLRQARSLVQRALKEGLPPDLLEEAATTAEDARDQMLAG